MVSHAVGGGSKYCGGGGGGVGRMKPQFTTDKAKLQLHGTV